MKKRTKYLIGLILIAGLGGAFAWQAYNAGPRDLLKAKADLAIEANQLLTHFQEDETKANSMYLDKIIVVEGLIASIEDSKSKNITLETEDMMSAVVCEMTNSFDTQSFSVGDRVKVKGQCTGFLSDVILVKCVIEQ